MDSVLRALVVYVVLLLLFRIAGKRALAEITTFDFVLLLIIGESTQQALIGSDFSITNACMLIATLLGLEIGLSWLPLLVPPLGRALDSHPVVLLEHGRLLEDRMRRERVNQEDILAAAREQRGLTRLEQIAYAVLERDGQRVLPIWVGAAEGNAIALALAGVGTPRPMSLSLMHRVLGMANIAIERVVITALRDNIFYAQLTLRIDGRPQEVDARPSDAITLALYAGAPVFVTPEMLELPVVVNASDALPALEAQNERARVEKGRPVEDPPMEWRSFRALPDPRTAAR